MPQCVSFPAQAPGHCVPQPLSAAPHAWGAALPCVLACAHAGVQVKSAEIEKALAASARASEELDRQRDVYRPFATAGSKLFFLVQVRLNSLPGAAAQ